MRISVPEGSVNFSLANWLAGVDTAVPKRLVFDDLNFETGSTRLTPDSVATVTNLVAVLNAYPAVSVGLEGYTDSTGDPAANSRITTEGYGQERPLAPNDTEQGRAQNRRLELVVLKR